MKRTFFLCALFSFLFLLSACGELVVGVEMFQVFDENGEFFLSFGVGFRPDPEADEEEREPVTCSGEDTAYGAVIRDERGSDTWCLYEANYPSLAEGKEELETEFGPELIDFRCVGQSDELFIYDVSLFGGAEAEDAFAEGGGEEEGYLYWEVTIPGPIEQHNGTLVDENTVSWRWDALSAAQPPLELQINVPEDGSCPLNRVTLDWVVDETFSGSLRLGVPTEGMTLLAGPLGEAGWNSEGTHWFARFENEGELTDLLDAIPGVDRVGDQEKAPYLEIVEDMDNQRREYTALLRFDPAAHTAFWTEEEGDRPVPSFRYELFLPGAVTDVTGSWTDSTMVVYQWQPGGETGSRGASMRATSQLEPEIPYTEEDIQRNVDTLLERFMSETALGDPVADPTAIQQTLGVIFPPGWVNNMTGGATVCGEYQTRILTWLNNLRRSSRPETRALLAGLEYGPVQAYAGGHQAVVLYPRDTDWRQTGIVLDPWPSQRPEHFTFAQWGDRFSWGIGPGQGANNYPHLLGRPRAYPIEIGDNSRRVTHLAVNSPVAVMITAADGRRLGVDDAGNYVTEIGGADYYMEPKGDGTTRYLFSLPPGAYEVELTGTGAGDYHVLVGDGEGNLVTYGARSIETGQQARLAVDTDEPLETELVTPAGDPVAPILVTDENVTTLEFGEPAERGPGGAGAEETGSISGDVDEFLSSVSPAAGWSIAGGLFLICFASLLFLTGGTYIVVRRMRRKT